MTYYGRPDTIQSLERENTTKVASIITGLGNSIQKNTLLKSSPIEDYTRGTASGGSSVDDEEIAGITITKTESSGEIEFDLSIPGLAGFFLPNINADANISFIEAPATADFSFVTEIHFVQDAVLDDDGEETNKPTITFPNTVTDIPEFDTSAGKRVKLEFVTADSGMSWTVLDITGFTDQAITNLENTVSFIEMGIATLNTQVTGLLADVLGIPMAVLDWIKADTGIIGQIYDRYEGSTQPTDLLRAVDAVSGYVLSWLEDDQGFLGKIYRLAIGSIPANFLTNLLNNPVNTILDSIPVIKDINAWYKALPVTTAGNGDFFTVTGDEIVPIQILKGLAHETNAFLQFHTKGITNWLASTASGVFGAINTAWTGVTGLVTWLGNLFSNTWATLAVTAAEIGGSIINWLVEGTSGVLGAIYNIWTGAGTYLTGFLNLVKSFFDSPITSITNYLGQNWTKIVNFLGDVGGAVVEALGQAWTDVTTFLSDVGGAITTALTNTYTWLRTSFNDTIIALGTGIESAWRWLTSIGGELQSGISLVGGLFSGAVHAGAQFATLVSGAIADTASGVLDGIATFLLGGASDTSTGTVTVETLSNGLIQISWEGIEGDLFTVKSYIGNVETDIGLTTQNSYFVSSANPNFDQISNADRIGVAPIDNDNVTGAFTYNTSQSGTSQTYLNSPIGMSVNSESPGTIGFDISSISTSTAAMEVMTEFDNFNLRANDRDTPTGPLDVVFDAILDVFGVGGGNDFADISTPLTFNLALNTIGADDTKNLGYDANGDMYLKMPISDNVLRVQSGGQTQIEIGDKSIKLADGVVGPTENGEIRRVGDSIWIQVGDKTVDLAHVGSGGGVTLGPETDGQFYFPTYTWDLGVDTPEKFNFLLGSAIGTVAIIITVASTPNTHALRPSTVYLCIKSVGPDFGDATINGHWDTHHLRYNGGTFDRRSTGLRIDDLEHVRKRGTIVDGPNGGSPVNSEYPDGDNTWMLYQTSFNQYELAVKRNGPPYRGTLHRTVATAGVDNLGTTGLDPAELLSTTMPSVTTISTGADLDAAFGEDDGSVGVTHDGGQGATAGQFWAKINGFWVFGTFDAFT